MPICAGCGGSYDNKLELCPHCGRAKPYPLKTKLEVEVTPRQTPDDCPICGDAFNVQKVTAIVDAGTSESNSYSYSSGKSSIYSTASGRKVGTGHISGSAHSSGFSQSKLAEKLAPAVAPEYPSEKPEDFLPLGLCTLLFVSLIFVALKNESLLLAGAAFFVGIWVMLIFGKEKKTAVRYKSSMKVYKKELSDFEETLIQWRKLFYCHKHDVVFVPGSKDYAPSEQTWQACLAWSGKKAT